MSCTKSAVLAAACALAHAAPAAAERPRTGYVVADPQWVDVATPTSHNSNIIFLNGCFDGGCTISPGYESSVKNRSSIISQTSTLPPFDAGVSAWDALLECVRSAYAPFDIEITDEDPSPQPHFEAIVAGRPQDIGFGSSIGGVSPFSCGIINNAITFSFAQVYGGNMAQLCWTVSQETAHAFGLDHEFLCKDPMTYLGSCGAHKSFQDEAAPCGEWATRPCQCGIAEQNSVQMIMNEFGPGTPTPPDVTITEPKNGASVKKGFVVRADAVDDVGVVRVELWINNERVATADESPFVFHAPLDLSTGILIVEVRAVDNFGAVGADRITVTQGAPCTEAADCGGAKTCVDGRCVAGPGSPGGLGESCEDDEDCASRICGTDGVIDVCVERCQVGNHGCPAGFGCRDAGDSGLCWPGYDDGDGGCGCDAAGPSDAAPLLVLAALALLGFRRRRS